MPGLRVWAVREQADRPFPVLLKQMCAMMSVQWRHPKIPKMYDVTGLVTLVFGLVSMDFVLLFAEAKALNRTSELTSFATLSPQVAREP